MKPISGSQNLTINYLELLLLRDRDEASQARTTPTIRTYLWPRYHAIKTHGSESRGQE